MEEILFDKQSGNNGNGTVLQSNGQTCLERFGMMARQRHILRNEWSRDIEYTKPLVDEEYTVQTEFKVS